MYSPPKKFLPVWWHLSRVLLESAVWVRPAQVGALFLHNLRVCLTFEHVMYPQNNSYTTWGCADSFGMLCTYKIMLHYSYTTWGCADFFGVFQAVCRKGLGAGWWPFTGIDPFWVLGTTKRSCVQTETRCAGETLAMSLTWGSWWLVRLGVLFFAFNIYTYVMFSFIEVGESKFIRVQWKKLFTCAVHVSLLSVRSHESCLITVSCMFANQRLGEYSIKT
jgi:hypothetical protein